MAYDDNLEIMLDKISEKLIQSQLVNISDVEGAQKTIRNGILSLGRTNSSETLILHQKDTKANEDDLNLSNLQNGEITTLQSIASGIVDTNSINIGILPSESGLQISLTHGAISFNYDITPLLTEVTINEDGTETIINPLNISQFFNIEETRTTINKEQANEFLDTNIYELLPDSTLRQEQINQLFIDIQNLLPPPPTEESFMDESGRVDRNDDGDWVGSTEYYLDNSISATQDSDNATIDEASAYITRLSDNGGSQNSGKTIEELRDRLNDYLVDIDEEALDNPEELPEYKNQSSGYLKFRNLNQGIIIRNTNQDFIEGLNPNNPTYLTTGFTISMWVRFLDKTSNGTLFNFGNPTRSENPFGFKLETYVLNKNDAYASISQERTWGEVVEGGTFAVGPGYDERIFKDSDVARFVRLQVRESGDTTPTGDDLGLRDSHVGLGGDLTLNGNVIGNARKSYNVGDLNDYGSDELRLLQSTYIPEDFNEWYFICATFNPTILEDESIVLGYPFTYTPDFWMNNINPDNDSYTANSDYGNKCKVEIISRSDLLRARGYKVD